MRVKVKNRINKHFITIYGEEKPSNDVDIFTPKIRQEFIILKDYPCEIENLDIDFKQNKESYNAMLAGDKKAILTYDENNPIKFQNGMKVKICNQFETIMGTISGYKWYYGINLLYLVIKIDSLVSNGL